METLDKKKKKFYFLFLKTGILLLLVLTILVNLSIFLFELETKKINFANDYVYVVSRKVPIEIIDEYQDLFRFLSISALLKLPKYAIVEKFDLKNGKLIDRKKMKLSIDDYLAHGFNIDTHTDREKIIIFPINSMKFLQFNVKEKDNVLYDCAKEIFFSNHKVKMLKLKSENDFEEIEIPLPLEPIFYAKDIDNSNVLILNLKNIGDHREYFYQLFNIDTKKIKEIDLRGEEWTIKGIKGLKILAHKIGTGEFFFIELNETEKLFQIKNIQSLHHSKSFLDTFDWDKKNNKIYFYNSGDAHFQNNFDVYQYDDKTLVQKIIHVKLKR